MKRVIRYLLRKAGYQLIKTPSKPPEPIDYLEMNKIIHNELFSNLKEVGFNPGHIVDIGANHGSWTRQTLRYFPKARYTLLEPQESLKYSIRDLLESNPNVQFYPMGVGSKKGVMKFTILDRDDSSSFSFSKEEADKMGFEQVDVPVTTLNDLVTEENLPPPDLVKIDAEGLDLDVLAGCSNFMGKTEMFMVEVGMGNKRIDNSFLNVINFMNDHGYRLFEITEFNRPYKPSFLWLLEAVFVKKNGFLDSVKLA
jgi:FkbM family methyltransferase